MRFLLGIGRVLAALLLASALLALFLGAVGLALWACWVLPWVGWPALVLIFVIAGRAHRAAAEYEWKRLEREGSRSGDLM
jgi:hypothetical protein